MLYWYITKKKADILPELFLFSSGKTNMFVPQKQGLSGNILQETFWCCFVSSREGRVQQGEQLFLITVNFPTNKATVTWSADSAFEFENSVATERERRQWRQRY